VCARVGPLGLACSGFACPRESRMQRTGTLYPRAKLCQKLLGRRTLHMYQVQPAACTHAAGFCVSLDFLHLPVLSEVTRAGGGQLGTTLRVPRRSAASRVSRRQAEDPLAASGWSEGVHQQARHPRRPCLFPQGVSFSCLSLPTTLSTVSALLGGSEELI